MGWRWREAGSQVSGKRFRIVGYMDRNDRNSYNNLQNGAICRVYYDLLELYI